MSPDTTHERSHNAPGVVARPGDDAINDSSSASETAKRDREKSVVGLVQPAAMTPIREQSCSDASESRRLRRGEKRFGMFGARKEGSQGGMGQWRRYQGFRYTVGIRSQSGGMS